MTKAEEYCLKFVKVRNENNKIRYRCIQLEVTNDSKYLCRLIENLSNESHLNLYEEVTNAINGLQYDEDFLFDVATEELLINPPNALFDNEYTISLENLKELLEEWITFCSS